MSQVEIPKEKWQSFCDSFSRQHQSWIVHVSIGDRAIASEIKAVDAENAMHPLTRSTVFQGISAEEHDGHYTISVIAGLPPDQITHFIYDPAQVVFLQTEEGFHEGLIVRSASGQTTLLRFRAAALPEILDGISEEILRTA